MKKIIVVTFIVSLFAACSSPQPTNNTTNTNTTSKESHDTKKADDVPASIRAVFPNAQSITKEHKDIPASAITSIEKETGGKVPDTDHHAYFAFSTEGGAKKQIGAASIVKAGGKDVVIAYESKDGSPRIKEVKADGVAQNFLDQFKNKNHDDKLQIGSLIKTQGIDEGLAKAITTAVYVDLMTMQMLYGAAHTH
jgi:hypothetical protein